MQFDETMLLKEEPEANIDSPVKSGDKRKTPSAQLIRQSYPCSATHSNRHYFVYLPKGYSTDQSPWPMILFLHGDGERGDGNDELNFVLKHGPLFEALMQKKDLPFVIVAPQLPMFGRDKKGIPYLQNRVPFELPENPQPRPNPSQPNNASIRRLKYCGFRPSWQKALPNGWERIETDLCSILDSVTENYAVDTQRIYLTGLSYGGFGTWYLASKHPNRFAAIAPVCAWIAPELARPIAHHQIPVWQFAGGLDDVIKIRHFYAGAQKLKSLGLKNNRFTVHEDLGHDVWRRVYASSDLYEWLLEHSR